MQKKIIDGHMHIAQWVREDGKIVFDCIKEYQENNEIVFVDNMCSTNNADLWQGYEMDQSILGAIVKLENPFVFAHGCLYIPGDLEQAKKYDFKSQLDELMEIGMDGIKICDFKPDAYKALHVEDRLEEYDEYLGYCEKYKIHVCWHVADPEDFWDAKKIPNHMKKLGWFYGDGSYASYESLIGFTYKMLDKHPNLHVLLAHAFFKSFQPDEVEHLLTKYPNVSLDLAPGWEMFDGFRTHYEKWYVLFRKYSDRFVYATDSLMTKPEDYVNRRAQHVLRFLQTEDIFEVGGNHIAQGIKLEQEHLDKVLYKNHERMVGKEPRPIHRAALKRYIERYLPLMPDSRNKQMTEAYCRKNL